MLTFLVCKVSEIKPTSISVVQYLPFCDGTDLRKEEILNPWEYTVVGICNALKKSRLKIIITHVLNIYCHYINIHHWICPKPVPRDRALSALQLDIKFMGMRVSALS